MLHPAGNMVDRGSVKTLRSLHSAEFWGHCLLSGGTQRHALPRYERFLEWESNPQPVDYRHKVVLLRYDLSQKINIYIKYYVL